MPLLQKLKQLRRNSDKKIPARREREGQPLEHWKAFENNEAFFKANLTQAEYKVLRKDDTEWPRSSTYDDFYPRKGHFACRACGLALYSAKSKFDSGTGWPSFGSHVQGNIKTSVDYRMGKRIELSCARCSSHLGHVFAEKNKSKFNPFEIHQERQCVNGIALMYLESKLPASSNASASALSEERSQSQVSSQ